jgi:hypothetical protein
LSLAVFAWYHLRDSAPFVFASADETTEDVLSITSFQEWLSGAVLAEVFRGCVFRAGRYSPISEYCASRKDYTVKRLTAFLPSLVFLVACSAHNSAVPPTQSVPEGAVTPTGAPNATDPNLRVPTADDALASNGGKLHSFAQAQNLLLQTDADYGRFVDSSIVGAARKQAIKFLEFMPPGMRGDYVYIGDGGLVTSNRSDLPAMVKSVKSNLPLTSTVADASSRKSPMEYPPTSGGGGPFIRVYSSQGINAAFGIADPPCDVNLNQNNHDSGNMYFNAWSPNITGSVTDAGIGADEYPSSDTTESDVFPFVNSSGTWDPSQYSSQGFVNETNHWQCNTQLVILYGTLASPWQDVSVLVVGPPTYNPMQYQLPQATVTLTNPAWTFFVTPVWLRSDGGEGITSGTYQGIPTNCTGCTVAMMYSIGEQYGPDGSCYGMCGTAGDAAWNEVVMGQLVSPCGSGSLTSNSFGLSNPCTIQFAVPNSWEVNYIISGTGGDNLVFPNNDQSGNEGIQDPQYPNLSGAQRVAFTSTLQPANLPTAPPTACTPDSYGYCMLTLTAPSCTFKEVGPKGDPTPVWTYVQGKFEVFQQQKYLEYLGTYTESWNGDGSGCGQLVWSPANPSTVYNDPDL